MAGSVGTLFVELDLDATRYTKSQQRLLQDAQQASSTLEQNFQNVGIKSAAAMDLMRSKIQLSFEAIKNSGKATANDILRAEEAKNSKLKALNDQQFGASTSMIDKLKSHWIAATIAITAAIALISKAWNMAEAGAAYLEQMQHLNALSKQYNTTADAIVSAMTRAGEGLISMGAASEIAAGALARGITPEQLTELSRAAAVMHDFMGVKTDEALKMFVKALETGRTKSIAAAVGVQAIDDATDEMIGKMTGAQKATMGFNAIMEISGQVSAKLGDSVASIDDKMEKFEVTLKNLNVEMGIMVIRGGALLIAAFQGMAAAALAAAAGVFKLLSALSQSSSKSKEYADDATAAWEASIAMTKDAQKNMNLATASQKELTAATGKGTAANIEHVDSAKKKAEALKETMKAMEALIPIIAKTGEEQLKFAKTGFDEALKKEGATLNELAQGLNDYMAKLQAVYTARIEGEKAIADAMKKAGGKPEEVLKAQLEGLKQEKALSEARLDAWKTYYTTLEGLHSKATELMKTKTQELRKLEESAAAQRMSHAMQMMGLQEKLMMAQGAAATDLAIREMKLSMIAQERAAANQLSGDAQIKALEAVKGKYAELTEQVTTEGRRYDETTGTWVKTLNTVVTAEDSIRQAMSNVASVQGDINQATEVAVIAKKKEIDTLGEYKDKIKAAMEEAKTQMSSYQEKILEVSKSISNIERDIAVKVSIAPGILAEIALLEAAINAATRPRTVQITIQKTETGGGEGVTTASAEGTRTYTNELGTFPEGYSGPDYEGPNSSPPMDRPGDEYALGLPYVPRDNFKARLHEGEAVLTKEEATAWRKGGGQVINFNPSINIVGANKSAEQLAREIVKPLQSEMRRLAVVS